MSEILDPSKLKVAELREELQARGLDTKGNKAALVDRLAEALEQEGEDGGSRRLLTGHASGNHDTDNEEDEEEDEENESDTPQTELEEDGQEENEENESDTPQIEQEEEQQEVENESDSPQRDQEDEQQENENRSATPQIEQEEEQQEVENESDTPQTEQDDEGQQEVENEIDTPQTVQEDEGQQETENESETPQTDLELGGQQEKEESGGQQEGGNYEEYEQQGNEQYQEAEQPAESEQGYEQVAEPEDEQQYESGNATVKQEPYDENAGNDENYGYGGKDGYEANPKDGYEDAPMEQASIKQERDNGERETSQREVPPQREIKQEPPEVEVKRERTDNRTDNRDRHGEKRRWSDNRDAPDFKRQRRDIEEVHMLNEPQTDKSEVQLCWYNSDMSVKIDPDTFLSASPMTEHGFGYVWHGVKATYGFTHGRIYYEAVITEEIPVPHLEAEEQHPHVLRVGWSIDEAGMVLGEEKLSYGYGGTGKASVNLKFKDYGGPYGKGDILGCYLDMDSEPARISYTINGRHKGICYEVSRYELGNKALFPHIVTKNCGFKVNFGTEAPWAEPLVGYTCAGDVPIEERVLCTQGPEKRSEGEIIMMIGLPACGKTTWVNKFCQENAFKKYNILGTNGLIDKMKVNGLPRKRNYAGRWEVLIERCTKCLNTLLSMSGKRMRNFIIDQTNVYPSAQRRKMKGFNGFTRRAVIICPSDEDLKRRTEKREKEEGKDVPDKAVLEMKANFKLPEENDLFDVIQFVEEDRESAEKLVEMYNKEGQDAGFGQKNRGFNKPYRNDNRNRGGYMDRRGGYGNRGGGGGGGDRGGDRGGWNRDRDNNRGGGGGWNRDRDNNRGSGGGGGWNRDRDNNRSGGGGGWNRDRDNRGGGRDNNRGGGGGGWNRDRDNRGSGGRDNRGGGGGWNRDRQSGSSWNQNKSQNQSIETVKSNPWASSNTSQGSGSSSYGSSSYGSSQGYGSSNQSQGYNQSYQAPTSTTSGGYNQSYGQGGWNQQYYNAQQGYWGQQQGYNYGAQQQTGYNAATTQGGYGTQTQSYGSTGQQGYGSTSNSSASGYGQSTQQSWGGYGSSGYQSQGGYRR